MPLTTSEGTFLTSKESSELLNMAYSTFTNIRTGKGDAFLRGRRDLVPGRVFFRAEDVQRLARERAA